MLLSLFFYPESVIANAYNLFLNYLPLPLDLTEESLLNFKNLAKLILVLSFYTDVPKESKASLTSLLIYSNLSKSNFNL
jgi:hypothetical protein